MALDDWCLPEDDRPLVSDESPTCGLHRGADDRWNAPGLASVVRLRVCSASVLGSRLLETAGRLEDPLDRPSKVELENIASFEVDWSCLIGDFCLARLPAFIAGGGTWRRMPSISDHPLLLPSSVTDCLFAMGAIPELCPAAAAMARGGALVICDC